MAIDTIRNERLNGLKLPQLEGRVKITLHNCRTGKNEIIEGKNIVSNAVRDIFANNDLGIINYANMLPLYSKWYGGVLLFKNAHALNGGNLDPNNYFQRGLDNNPLTAHAGDQAPSSASIVEEDLSRGSPINTLITDTSAKMSWEWGTTQGNGQISALSLTHKDTGNAGLGNTSTEFQNFIPFEHIEQSGMSANQRAYADGNAFVKYDDNHTLFFYIGADGAYTYNNIKVSTYAGTNDITVYVRRMAYSKASLFETLVGRETDQRSFTITTSVKFYCQPCFYFDYSTKYLWLFSNMTARSTASTSVMQYTVIDCVNETEVTHGTITNDSPSSYPFAQIGGRDQTSGGYIFRNDGYVHLIKDGNYVWLPMGTGSSTFDSSSAKINQTGWIKIKLDSTDQEVYSFDSTNLYWKPAMKNGEILVGFTHVINGGEVYKCGSLPNGSGADTMKWIINEPQKISSLVSRMSTSMYDTTAQERWILAQKMVNTTLFNLPSQVEKTTSQSMTVEYTLTEVTT